MSVLRWIWWWFVAAVILVGLMPGVSYAGAVVVERAFGIERFGTLQINLLIGLPFVLLGCVWMAWSWKTLRSFGRGSPLHAFGKSVDPTRRLCTVGPYRYTQNPMYFGWLSTLAGVGLMLGSIVFAIGVPLLWTAFAHWYLRRWEWPDLERRFGAEWRDWHARTPAILPRPWQRPAAAAVGRH